VTIDADSTGRGLVDFLDYAAAKGLMPTATAMARKSAVRKVLGIDGEWEAIDLRNLDLEGQVQRFETLKKADYAPKSLSTYSSRFRTAIDEYFRYLDDPSAYRPSSNGKRTAIRRRLPATASESSTTGESVAPHAPPPREGLTTFPFPLDEASTAYFQLPRVLTAAQVDRAYRFLQSLVFEDPEDKPSAP
jgi:hypothetical protein